MRGSAADKGLWLYSCPCPRALSTRTQVADSKERATEEQDHQQTCTSEGDVVCVAPTVEFAWRAVLASKSGPAENSAPCKRENYVDCQETLRVFPCDAPLVLESETMEDTAAWRSGRVVLLVHVATEFRVLTTST